MNGARPSADRPIGRNGSMPGFQPIVHRVLSTVARDRRLLAVAGLFTAWLVAAERFAPFACAAMRATRALQEDE